MQMYGLGNGTTFGWATFHHDPHLDILANGRVCSSGIAFPIQDPTNENIYPVGTCIDVKYLRTNTDNYTDISEPSKCESRSSGSYCRYYWANGKLDYYELKCHCGMGGGPGICPLPGPNAVN